MVLHEGITYEEELKKNPELKESDMQVLREWCANQPHLPKIPDVQLALFLHSNYFRMESTKTTIEAYYTIRSQNPEFFSNRDPVGSKELRRMYTTFAFIGLKKLTDDGYNITYTKLLDPDPSHYDFNISTKLTHMFCDLWLQKHGSRTGYVLIFNTRGASLSHLTRLNLMGLKTYVNYLQDALPIRLKRIHVTNTIPVVKIFMAMIKPFMKKEIYDMIYLHTAGEDLEKFIPLDALPNEDGGKGGNVADIVAEHIKWLEDNRAWFQIEETTMRANESLRRGTNETSSNVRGLKRFFKRQDID